MTNTSFIAQTADVFRTGQEAEERRCDYVCVLALVDTTAPRSLVLPVRDVLMPRLPTADVRVVGVGGSNSLLVPTKPDVCVALVGSDGRSVAKDVRELAEAGVPVALVVESALDAPTLSLSDDDARRVSILSATNSDVLLDRLAEWLVGATDKSIAMAANFPFCRRAKVRELTKEYATELAVQTAKKGPGSELPSMTANQASLALTIAAINGQPLSLGRIPEVLSAIGTGYGSRMFANKTLGKLPVIGWLFQAGFGYIGTQATGYSLQRRFDKKELRALGELPERTALGGAVEKVLQLASGAVSNVRGREGVAVRSSSGSEVRLLPESQDGGFLLYD
ncbi:MAG: hypothetical protein J6D34_02950 [Atopobiaceae bacterium]|nr:hypothetical protein [Atopobiaceae bacterium]